MRNLKRALSLALASVMLLGMMMVGSSAKGLDDFTDSSDIVNQDAVAVTTAIGMFEGYEDGSFKPENVVTRAEMAVIICTMLYGAGVNVNQFAETNVFTDVPDWAAGYVNLCASLGIVAGVGDGKFDPNATVTTAQAVLMLCRALGYFQSATDFGSDWQLAATAKGTALGMYGDLKLSAAAGLTRDNVAELVFNALTKASTVEYNETFNMYYTTGSDWANGVEFNYKETLGYKNFDLVYMSDDKDDFGRPCTVWGTGSLNDSDIDDDGNIEDDYDRIADDDIIINSPNDAKYTYTAKITSKDLYSDLGSDVVRNSDYDWSIYVNGEEDVDVDAIRESLYENRSEDDGEFAKMAGEDELTGNGVLTQVYVDTEDKTVDVVIIYTYAAEVLTVDEDAGVITLSDLNGTGPVDSDDEFETVAFAEDEIVLYTYADDEIQSVKAAERMEGEVTRVRSNTSGGDANTGDNFVVDGITYKYTFSESMPANERLTTDNVDNDVVAYLDEYGYVIYIDEDAVSYDYAYVLTIGSGSDDYGGDEDKNTLYARLVLTDGTMVKAELDNSGAGEMAKLKNQVVSYSVDSKDVYTLTVKSDEPMTDSPDLSIENGKASLKGIGGENYAGNSNTIFVVMDSDEDSYDDYDITVYEGIKNVPDIDGDANTQAAVATESDSNLAKAVFIIDGDVSGVDTVIYAIANSNAKLQKDTDLGEYYEIDAVEGGEKTTLMVKASSSAADKLVKDIDDGYAPVSSTKSVVALKSVTRNSDDLVTSVKLYEEKDEDGDGVLDDNGLLYVQGTKKAENSTVGLGGTSYAYDDDVVVARYTVDEKTIKMSRISAVKTDGNDLAVAIMDGDVIIGLFIVEQDGEEAPEAYDITVKVNGVEDTTLAQTDLEAGTYTVEYTLPAGQNLTSVTGGTYTVDGQKVTITVSVTNADVTVEIKTDAAPVTYTLRLTAEDLLTAEVYTDAAGEALEPTKTETRFGEIVAVEYTIPEGETATIVYKDGQDFKEKVVKMTDDVTITDADMGIEDGTKVTITVDGTVMATPDKNQEGGVALSGLTPKGWYLIDGTTSKQADEDGKMTITDTSKNRVLVSAGKITISGNNATAVDADEKEIKDGAVIANGETITLTITDTVKITANGEEEIVTETGTETLTVNGDIKVEDWETQEEFEANVAEAIEENVKTNAANKVTIDEKSNTVTVTVNSLTASGTGLMDLVKTLVDAGYDVTVEHNGYEYVLKGDTSADKATLSKLVVAGARTTLTVTISSDMAEDDIVYTVNVDASELTVAAG